MSVSDFCISSNPDVSGIGVRAATYAQTLLSFVPALHAINDGKVTPTELQTLETQSTTILITGFAILISTIVQALTGRLSNYHASIILNLSWMNNTNTFIYFLLYVYHKIGVAQENKGGSNLRDAFSWVKLAKEVLRNRVFVIGSLHLSLMAAVGIWLWSRPASFGDSPPCSMSASIVILGGRIPLSSTALRGWSLFIYSLLLLPGWNLLIPAGLFIIPYIKYVLPYSSNSSPKLARRPVTIGLVFLAVINIFFLADTEVAIHVDRPLLQEGDNLWTFGQTLALLLLLIPLRDLLETVLERRPKALGKRLLIASKEGQMDVARYVVELGANFDVMDKDGSAALVLAAQGGHRDIVKHLIEHGANVDASDRDGSTALVLTMQNGHGDVAKHLIEHGANAEGKDKDGNTVLALAAWKGNLDMVQYLTEFGANVNVKNNYGDTGPVLASWNGHAECWAKSPTWRQ